MSDSQRPQKLVRLDHDLIQDAARLLVPLPSWYEDFLFDGESSGVEDIGLEAGDDDDDDDKDFLARPYMAPKGAPSTSASMAVAGGSGTSVSTGSAQAAATHAPLHSPDSQVKVTQALKHKSHERSSVEYQVDDHKYDVHVGVDCGSLKRAIVYREKNLRVGSSVSSIKYQIANSVLKKRLKEALQHAQVHPFPAKDLKAFIREVSEEYKEFFEDSAFSKLLSDLEADQSDVNPPVSIGVDDKYVFCAVPNLKGSKAYFRHDKVLCQPSGFEPLPSLEELEDQYDTKAVFREGHVDAEQSRKLRTSFVVRLLFRLIVMCRQVRTVREATSLLGDADDYYTHALNEEHLQPIIDYRGRYVHVRLGKSSRAWPVARSDTAEEFFKRLQDAVRTHPESTVDAQVRIFSQVLNTVAPPPTLQSLVSDFLDMSTENPPVNIAKEVVRRITHYPCPIVGINSDTDFFRCEILSGRNASGFVGKFHPHERLEAIPASQMGKPTKCLIHAAVKDSRFFVARWWAERSYKAFSEFRSKQAADPIEVSEILDGIYPMTPGFEPLVSLPEDPEIQAQLVRYLTDKTEAPPHSSFQVESAFLERTSTPRAFDMSRFLNSDYCRYLDLKSILSLRRPSIDKEVAYQWDTQEHTWIQHRAPNLLLTSWHINKAKGPFFTPLAFELLYFALFINQTARPVIGDQRSLSILDRIEFHLTAHFHSGDPAYFGKLSRQGPPSSPEENVLRVSRSMSGLPRVFGTVPIIGKEPDTGIEHPQALAHAKVASVSSVSSEGLSSEGDVTSREESETRSRIKAPYQSPSQESAIKRLVQQLEDMYGGTVPKTTDGFPNPYGFEGSNAKKQVLDFAAGLVETTRTACDQIRVSKGVLAFPIDRLMLSDQELAWYKHLAKYSSDHNSMVTQILVHSQWLLKHGTPMRCHGTGLKLVFTNELHHPLKASFGHAIHGVPCSHGFSSSFPVAINKDTLDEDAQNFAVESWFFNWWRSGHRRLIAGLDLNKSFGIAFSRLQTVDPEFTLDSEVLETISQLPVRWQDSMDPRIEINSYGSTEQVIWDRLVSP